MLIFFCAAQWALSVSPTLIEHVRVEVGDGTVLENANVLLNSGRIAAVGEKFRVPNGVQRVEGKGLVLTPGFIETLTQLGLTEVDMEELSNDYALYGDMVPGFRAADGFNPRSVRIPIERQGGVTDAVLAPRGALLNGSGAWFSLTGDSSGAPNPDEPVGMFAGIGAGVALHAAAEGARGGAWLKLRQAFEDARFYLEHRQAVDKGQARTLSLSPLHLRALIPVLLRRMPLVLHVHRASDIRAALRFKKTENILLVIAGGTESWLVADALRQAQVPVIFRPRGLRPASFDTLAAREDLATVLSDKGVRFAISAVDWANNIRRLRQEAGIAVAHGLKRSEAIRAITQTPAEIFGKGKEIGTVTVGKRANVVLWSGDPLEHSSTVKRLWIDGKPMSLRTRQTELAERYRRTP